MDDPAAMRANMSTATVMSSPLRASTFAGLLQLALSSGDCVMQSVDDIGVHDDGTRSRPQQQQS